MKNTLLKGRYTPAKFAAQRHPLKRNHHKNGALSLLPKGNEIGCSFHMQGGKIMQKLIIATSVTAYIALCAAVWAQSEVIEETPAVAPTAAVCAADATGAKLKPEEELIPTENEITAVTQTEELQKSQPMAEPEPEPIEIPTDSENQLVQEQETVSDTTQEPVPTQTTKELQPGDLVYVPGFGWVAYEGPNRCEDGTDIYESGNKIGIMG